jgi:hypothetical protein
MTIKKVISILSEIIGTFLLNKVFKLCTLHSVMQTRWHSSNSPDSYSGDARFKSHPTHWILLLSALLDVSCAVPYNVMILSFVEL